MAGVAREPNSAYRAAFGERLRALRQERGISQMALAHASGIARSYVSGIELGLKNPALDHIVRLADVLELPPADLMPEPIYRKRMRRRSASS